MWNLNPSPHIRATYSYWRKQRTQEHNTISLYLSHSVNLEFLMNEWFNQGQSRDEIFFFGLASSPRDKRRADRDSLDLPPSLSPPSQLPGSQPPAYGMLPPQYQHLQNHMGPMMGPPQFQPPYQGPLNHMDSGEMPMEHGIQAIDECMMRQQQFNPGDMGGYPTVTSHNGQNHLELMHDMINSF